MLSTPDHAGHRSRLRTRLLGDADGLADYELVEYLLALAIPRRDTKPLAKALLREFGSFAQLIGADPDSLRRIDGMGDGAIAACQCCMHSGRWSACSRATCRLAGPSRADRRSASVDLPEALEPTMATMTPAGILRLTLWTKGVVAPGDVRIYAVLTLGAMKELFYQVVMRGLDFPEARIVDEMYAFLCRGVLRVDG